MTAKVKATMSERTENVVFGLRIAEKLKLDNGSDHRAGTIILQAEKSARKSGFACITLLSRVKSETGLHRTVPLLEDRKC